MERHKEHDGRTARQLLGFEIVHLNVSDGSLAGMRKLLNQSFDIDTKQPPARIR
jgi:hypothetical protein